MESRFLRIVYALQFAVTLVAFFEVWAQVGGQGHMDLMPWYAKLSLAGAASFAAVKATAATVARDRFWNPRAMSWLAAMAALVVAMGLITLYEHQHEEDEDQDSAPKVTNTLAIPPGRADLPWSVLRVDTDN